VEDILTLKAFVVRKTEPSPCFSCKIDILWVVPFLQNSGNVGPSPLPKRDRQDMRSSASSFNFQYLLVSVTASSSCSCLLSRLPTLMSLVLYSVLEDTSYGRCDKLRQHSLLLFYIQHSFPP